jgi:hypothetical protein
VGRKKYPVDWFVGGDGGICAGELGARAGEGEWVFIEGWWRRRGRRVRWGGSGWVGGREDGDWSAWLFLTTVANGEETTGTVCGVLGWGGFSVGGATTE